MELDTGLKIRIIKAMEEIRILGLFVHDEEFHDLRIQFDPYTDRPVYLIETLSVINTLVANGTMILYGGHGGGKTTLAKLLGRLFLDKKAYEIEEGILRGHNQLSEEKILGTLDISQLMDPNRKRDDRVDVIWSEFVKSEWKIIDEVNRLSPPGQNIILSLLAEGIAKYFDQTYKCSHYTLFATMNPKDEGSYELPLPFLDRFALAIPVKMPDTESFNAIDMIDKRIIEPSLSHTAILQKEIPRVWKIVNQVKIEKSAKEFIKTIIADSRLCINTDKEVNQDLHVNNGLCSNCRFNISAQVCNKIKNPLSVRVEQDLGRYGKAMAWFLGDSSVKIRHIYAIAPYAIWHRTEFSNDFLDDKGIYRPDEEQEKPRIFKSQLNAAKRIINEIKNKYAKRRPFVEKYHQLGSAGKEQRNQIIRELQEYKNDDMYIEKLYHYSTSFPSDVNMEKELDEADSLDSIDNLIAKIKSNYRLPNRSSILVEANRKRDLLFRKDAKESKKLVSKEKFVELIRDVDDKELKDEMTINLGEDLENMIPVRSYIFYTKEKIDKITLTLYTAREEPKIQCLIEGALTSDFNEQLNELSN